MKMIKAFKTCVVVFVCFIGTGFRVDAQLAPEIGYVHPAGIQSGTSTEVTLGGYDWTPDMQIFSYDPRVTIELLGPPTPVLISEPPYWFGAKARGYAWPLPREFRARITVPSDVPDGFVRWQVANANGVSPTGVIHIGKIPEVIEHEKSDRTGPLQLPRIPVAVSGQIRRIEEIDRYRIHAEQTGPITIELIARQLTSPTNPMALHGVLKVQDESGRVCVDVTESEGHDLTVTFAAEANRDYVISLHDLDFAGDRSYVYRLLVTNGPGLLAAYPSAGKRGETQAVEFVGWGIATGSAKIESVTREVTFPGDQNIDSFAYTLETPFGKTTPFSFVLSNFTELVERNEVMELPAAVTSAMDVRFGSKTHSVSMKKGDIWQISAKSRTTSLPLDLDLSLLAPDGKELATIDDVPGSTDPELTFTVPEDGIYRIVLTERSGHSGNRGACYRLSIERPREDFKVTVPDLLSVLLGASTKVSITVVRRGGFQGPINLEIEGLPVGITVPVNLVIPENKNELTVEFSCAADAPVSASLVKLTASATMNGIMVNRPVKTLCVAVIMKPKFKLTPEGLDDVSKVCRGSTHLFPLLVDRLDGFDGEIILEMTAKQQRHRQGLAGDEFIIEPSAKRIEYPIFVPEWMETTKTSRMILNGAIRVADSKGTMRTLLQTMEMRFGILPEGAMMKVTHRSGEYQAVIGEGLRIPLTVSRVPEFQEPVRRELVPSEGQKDSISAEPLSLPASESEVVLQVHIANNRQIVGEQKLLIRATAYQNGKWLVKSESTVAVEIRRSEIRD